MADEQDSHTVACSALAADTAVDQAPVIAPLVLRHAGDAAFYWQQRDGSLHAPLVGLAQLQEFDRLLDAHLDGLRAAADHGWTTALAQVERWSRAPEVFVGVTLALEQPEAQAIARLDTLWRLVQRQPQHMLRGWISALARLDSTHARAWCERLLSAGRPIPVPPALAVACWRTLALQSAPLSQSLTAVLSRALQSPEPAVRAAASRVAARHMPERLPALLDDADRQVRAEAAIGLAASSHRFVASNVLWNACDTLLQEAATLQGRYKAQAHHRLNRWLKHLGLLVPLGQPGMAKLLQLLPPRLGLSLVLHHGDAQYLPWVLEQMEDPGVSRLAGWVWSAWTGLDLQQQGLALPPREPGMPIRATDTLDPGLPEPDVGRVRALGLQLPHGQPSLWGLILDDDALHQLLVHAPQPLRWIAAQRLAMKGRAWMNIRAHGLDQRADLAVVTSQAEAA
jgi:hypothetical protein